MTTSFFGSKGGELSSGHFGLNFGYTRLVGGIESTKIFCLGLFKGKERQQTFENRTAGTSTRGSSPGT